MLAVEVGDEAVEAELGQLAREPDLQVRDAHHRREQDHRRARLIVAPDDEHALELLAFEIEGNRPLLAHSASLASSASLATLFMLRAVPDAAAGIRSFDWPWPLG